MENYLICLRVALELIATVVETCDANDAFRYVAPCLVIIVNEMYRYATNAMKKWKTDRLAEKILHSTLAYLVKSSYISTE